MKDAKITESFKVFNVTDLKDFTAMTVMKDV
jgi:hypothetical protein